MSENARNKKKISLGAAIGIFLFICVAVAAQSALFHADMGTMFFICWVVLLPVAMRYGYTAEELMSASFEFIQKALPAVFIFLSAGALIGTWIAAGTTPTIIYYGILIINPYFFLLTSLILCSAISLFTGSASGTVGTAGIAMMGIGETLGVPAPITAATVVTGAFFGNRMSPLADTTILSTTVVGVHIFRHLKNQLWDQIPAYLIASAVFVFLGIQHVGNMDMAYTQSIVNALESHFSLGLPTLLPLVVTGFFLAKRKPALLAVMAGAITATFVAVLYQGMPLAEAMNVFYKGYHMESDNPFMVTLLNRGGIGAMWSLAGITLFGFAVAGLLQYIGVIGTLADTMIRRVKSIRSLTFLTLFLGFFGNAVSLSQNFAIVMTGTLVTPLYQKFNLQLKNCSRDLEAGGTYGALFFPWNTNTIFAAGTLGVSALDFIPYLTLLYVTPIILMIFAFTKFRMIKIYDDEDYVDVTERLNKDPERLAMMGKE